MKLMKYLQIDRINLLHQIGHTAILLPLEFDTSQNILVDFTNVIKIYCKSYSTFYQDCILKKSVIDIRTYESIGKLYRHTKEYVRQIFEMHVENLKKLLVGKTVDKFRCDIIFLYNLNCFLNKIKKQSAFTQDQLNKILEEFNIQLTDQNEELLLLLFNVFDIKIYHLDRCKFYITRDIEKNEFFKTYSKCCNLFKKFVLPLTFNEIKQKINVSNHVLKAVLYVIPDIQIIANKYFIHAKRLSSFDVAYRILHEANTKLHHDDIFARVNHIRGFSIGNVVLTMDKERRFTAIGKTGYWVLNDSPINTEPIVEIIIKILKHLNKPCTRNELNSRILKERPDFEFKNLTTFISAYPNKFSRLTNGRIILKKWEFKFKKQIKTKNVRYSAEIITNIIEILKDGKILNTSQLADELHLKINIDRNLCMRRIQTIIFNNNKKNILNIFKHEGKVFCCLKKNYEYINMTCENNAISFIKDIFKQSNVTEMLVVDLVKISNNEPSISENYIYKVISKRKDIFKVDKSNYKNKVSLI